MYVTVGGSSNCNDKMNEHEVVLDWRIKYSYGLGHILNDLAASVWFTYNLLFYKLVFESNAFAFVVTGKYTDNTSLCCLFIYTNICIYTHLYDHFC